MLRVAPAVFPADGLLLRTGAAITVVADATRNVDADAGSILHVATVIDAPVLKSGKRDAYPTLASSFRTPTYDGNLGTPPFDNS